MKISLNPRSRNDEFVTATIEQATHRDRMQETRAAPPRPGRYDARVNRHARGVRPSRRPPALFTVLVAVILAVLGAGAYLAVHALGGRASAGTTTPPSVGPTVSVSPSPTPPPAPPPAGQFGDFDVAEQAYSFTEPANKHHGPRLLQVTVRYPVLRAALASSQAAGGNFPLVAFAPGFMQCSAAYRYLLHQWASAGYVVAGVNFPRTNCHIIKPDEPDLSNEPADVAYVIRRLVALSRQSQGPLSGLIAASKIAVAGHSDGGNLAAAMAGASCCQDYKIRASIVLAGNEWPWSGASWFAGHTPPMLFVQGTGDTCNPPQGSVQLYQADKTGTRYYLQLLGANHLTPYEGHGAPEPIVARVTLAFLDQYLAGQHGSSAALRQAGHVPGAAELLTAGQMPRANSPHGPTHC
jgi:dienelactone hydrolase